MGLNEKGINELGMVERGEQVGTELEWEWKRRAYTFACKRNRAGDFGWQSHYMIKEGCHLISVKKEALTSR